jgi:uncharacterized protein YutE (UPF0331/DUF86 family)
MLHELDAIERGLPGNLEAFRAADEDVRYALEHRVFVVVQAMLDVATHIAVVSDYRELESYGDALRALAVLGVVSPELASRLAGAAGLRNAIAHGYLELDQERLYAALSATDDMRGFAAELWTWVEQHGA